MDTGTDDGDDPAIARVRRELADLGRDEASAPPVPAEVTARIGSALRGRPAHTVERPRLRRGHVLGLVAGLTAAVIGVVVGAAMLTREPGPRLSPGPTASSITVTRPSPTIPLSAAQLTALLATAPDYGPLADPRQRGACLEALGYPPPVEVLGARPLTIDGRSAVVLLVPGDTADAVIALAVQPTCNSGRTGLLADTVVPRP